MKGGLQAGPAIIEIDIEIGKLPEIDCDHDFDFDHDSERPKCENKNALTFMASLLYYFGVLSLEGRTDQGKLTLRVPNLVMRKLYVEQTAEMHLPDPVDMSLLQ